MCKTIKQKVKFKISPRAVYDLFIDSKKHSALTGKKAVISEKPGSRFLFTAAILPGSPLILLWEKESFKLGVGAGFLPESFQWRQLI